MRCGVLPDTSTSASSALTLRLCLSAARGENQLPLRFVVLVQMSDQSLGAIVGVQKTLLVVSATQAAFGVPALVRPGRIRRLKHRGVGPDSLQRRLTFARSVVEPGMRTGAVAWKPPRKDHWRHLCSVWVTDV